MEAVYNKRYLIDTILLHEIIDNVPETFQFFAVEKQLG